MIFKKTVGNLYLSWCLWGNNRNSYNSIAFDTERAPYVSWVVLKDGIENRRKCRSEISVGFEAIDAFTPKIELNFLKVVGLNIV